MLFIGSALNLSWLLYSQEQCQSLNINDKRTGNTDKWNINQPGKYNITLIHSQSGATKRYSLAKLNLAFTGVEKRFSNLGEASLPSIGSTLARFHHFPRLNPEQNTTRSSSSPLIRKECILQVLEPSPTFPRPPSHSRALQITSHRESLK